MQDLLMFIATIIVVIFVLELFVTPWLMVGKLKERLGVTELEDEIAELRERLEDLERK